MKKLITSPFLTFVFFRFQSMVDIDWHISRAWVEAGVGVILRVPALFLLEAWYRTNPLKAIEVNTLDVEIIVTVVYYLGQ